MTNAQTSEHLFFKTKEASSHSNNKVLLILLHGRGSNEDDLFGLASQFPNNYIVVSARAPFELQKGYYQWYENTKVNGNIDGKAEDLKKSQKLIEEMVQTLQKKYNINRSHTVISGFSQGANLSYQMGLLYPELCKAIGVMGGTIFESQKGHIKKIHNISLDIFIGHGKEDDRQPFSNAEKSNQWLLSNKFKTDFNSYDGLRHSISQQEIRDFINFIEKYIK